MIRKIFIITTVFLMSMTAWAQETIVPDTTLHLPTLNNYGQMPRYINSWTTNNFMGYHNWDLHKGLNMNLGASVFTGFGDDAPSGAGFAQNLSGMYALSLSNKLSLAFGGYFTNANWGGFNFRDIGLNAVLGYQFDEHWEGYLYGQKSIIEPKVKWPYFTDDLGDRIGAAIRYNINPSIYVQLNVEYGTNRYEMPPYGRTAGRERDNRR